jgi:hypothetical protein
MVIVVSIFYTFLAVFTLIQALQGKPLIKSKASKEQSN